MITPLTSILILVALSCGSRSESDMAMSEQEDGYEGRGRGGQVGDVAAPAPISSSPKSSPAAKKAAEIGYVEESSEAEAAPMDDEAPGADKDQAASEPAAATRSWFPETFLFAPALVTDAEGRGQVEVTVPDRLTTWRVLALAHDRQGHQAGDVTSFQGTLPVYVEPVVPAFLVAGDQIRLPVAVLNTTKSAWSGPVSVDITGASTSAFRGELTVPAGASRVLAVPLAAPRAGELSIEVRLGQTDAIRRTVPVRPAGQRLEQVRGGTLASPRSIELEGAADMDPHSARVRVVVHPGALSILRRELLRAGTGGGDAADAAYGLLLAGTAPELLSALGEQLDGDDLDDLRTLSLQAGQRIMRPAMAPSTDQAALLLPATAAHPDNPVLARMATRMADQLAREQRPDGTYQGGGQTVQRMLVSTAEATAAVATLSTEPADQQRAARVRLSASAAFERHQGQIRDPYTAAAVLTSGAASPELTRTLRAMVREAIEQQPDGSRVLPVPADTVRSDGRAPSPMEATALAALALLDDPDAAELLPDMAGALLGAWRPGRGWGDGRADMLCTTAVATLLREPLPETVTIVLERDGQEVTRGALTGARRTELLVLDAPGDQARGLHTWTVRAEPAVPGLGFSLSLQTWVPWPAPPVGLGVELELDLPATLAVGRRASVSVSVAAPARSAFEIEQPLPAGVQVDEDSLSRLVVEGQLSSFEVEDGLVSLKVPAQDATTWTASFDVVPTLAGTVHADATRVTLASRPDLVFATPSEAWVVR